MMEQPTFADVEYESKKRKTRRERFLERMDGLIPWERLEGRIRPFYPTAGRGRHPYALSAMLRIHCVQLFYRDLCLILPTRTHPPHGGRAGAVVAALPVGLTGRIWAGPQSLFEI